MEQARLTFAKYSYLVSHQQFGAVAAKKFSIIIDVCNAGPCARLV
jgi:hypothetical protein